MEKFIQGYSGCAKTSKMLEEAESLLKAKRCSFSEMAFVTFSKAEKEELTERKSALPLLKEVCVFDTGELCKSFLPKDFSGLHEAFVYRHIISNICKDLFSDDYSMKALLKTESFSKELYELFCLFRKNEIRYSDLSNILGSVSLSDTDFCRLKLVFEVYDRYCKFLENAGYYDYYGLIYAALPSAYKKYRYLFVDDAEEISPGLRKFFSKVSDDVVFVENISFSQKQGITATKCLEQKRNQDIFCRIEAMKQKFFEGSSASFDFGRSDSLRYLEFSGFEEETAYIAEDIKKHLSEGARFSDFAIVPLDLQKKQQLVEFLSASNLPLNVVAYCEKFRNFVSKIIRYLNICVISKKLCLDEFSKEAICRAKLKSAVDEQIFLEEFDLYFENILSDIFDDIYKKDRFVFLHTSSRSRSLLLSVYKNLDILGDDDKSAFLKEMNTIKVVYSKFLESDFVGISDVLQQEFVDDESRELLKKFRNKLYALSLLYEKMGRNLCGEVVLRFLESDSLNVSDNRNCVSILSFNEVRQREFKYIYIPSLGDESFPRYAHATYFVSHEGNKKVSDAIRERFPDFSELIASDKFIFYEDLKNLYYALAKAKDGVVLSYHTGEAKKSSAPSIFFDFFKNNDHENFSVAGGGLLKKIENSPIETREKQISKAVFSDDDVLKLNASSISAFLSCERKFFYKNVLNLKEKSSFQASYGTVVHAILEVFNKTCLEDYTKERLIFLAEVLFNAKFDNEIALKTGYNQLVVSLVSSTDDLSLAEMKKKFLSALESMEQGGFFEEAPESACCEKSFEFDLPGVDGVVINGKIDVVLSKNGEYSLADYKTGEPKRPLSYYLSDYGVNFESDSSRNKGVFNENNVKNYQYQIPLYYLALQNAESLKEFKNKVKTLGLKYIRPSIRGEKKGYFEDIISADVIEEKKDKIIENISKTVIDKLRGITSFSKTADKRSCNSCAYAFLCGEEESSDVEQ